MEWIKCSDRLPEKGEDVLLCLDNNDITVGYLTYYNYFYSYEVYNTRHPNQVKAWMPLPEPPEVTP